MNDLQAWLTLYLTPNLGALGCGRLVEYFGGPLEVVKAKPKDLEQVKGIKKSALELLGKKPPFKEAERELEKAEALGVKIISVADDSYPSLLHNIYAPPVILYLRGNDALLANHFVAVVGSRAATSYGMKVARQMSADLCRRGVSVVSGMAMGIDTAAHYGCFDCAGSTVAVLGCGVDVVYPRQNKKLYDLIVERGLVVSEYPLATKPEGFRFPARNRIISGMAKGVLVVEAAKKSGSLITAKMALDEGREVFAVPGRVDSYKSAGTHKLLQDGAKLAHSVEDIIEEIGGGFPAANGYVKAGDETAGESLQVEPDEEILLAVLDVYPQPVDDLIVKSGLTASKVSQLLLLLELRGRVVSQPGQQYSLIQ